MKNQRLLKFWYWAGRVLPLTALSILIFSYAFGLDSWRNVITCIILVLFGTFAFTWWWWVLDTVKKLYSMLESAQDRFIEVMQELKGLKEDIKDDSDRKRNQPQKNKSK